MIGTLDNVLDKLRTHEGELRRLGVSHAAVFGSVARGEATADSDIDVLVELDRDRPLGIFQYARLKLYINEILNGAGADADVAVFSFQGWVTSANDSVPPVVTWSRKTRRYAALTTEFVG